jgi:DNA adenine methylase Dam
MNIKKVDLIKSPLNYTGGKYNLLPQILPLFPKDINTFVDVFCGGCNVGVNVKAEQIICNDSQREVIELFNFVKEVGVDVSLNGIDYWIDKYSLNKENKEGYLQLREWYNGNTTENYRNPIAFYVLVCHSFNNQIRFNSKGEFNLPFGKRCFNIVSRSKFVTFVEAIQEKNVIFTNKDFREVIHNIDKDSFLYFDPPYLISTATYNEKNGWTEKDERDLLELLDELNQNDIKFALSNVLIHKGLSNDILKEWSNKYYIHYLDYNYKNCSYQTKSKDKPTVEVLITNY